MESSFSILEISAGTKIKALDNADALIISTEWSIFRTPDFKMVKEKLNNAVIFDGRNLYDIDDMQNEGIQYISIGRKEVK